MLTRTVSPGRHNTKFRSCHGGCINLYSQSVIPKPYRKWYHKSYYIIVWGLMEIVYGILLV
jgi:hypothetical protein